MYNVCMYKYTARNEVDDLGAFAADSRLAEREPYTYAMTCVTTSLSYALDDGIRDSMTEAEIELLTRLLDHAREVDSLCR